MSNSPKKRVAFVINDFMVGGAQRLIADIVSRMDRERYEIAVVTLFSFPERESLYSLLPSHVKTYRHTFRSLLDVRAWAQLLRTLRTERFEVVFANLFFSTTVLAILKPFFRYRLYTVLHNTYIHKTPFEIFVDRLLLGAVEKVVAVSPTVRSFTAVQEHISLSRFEVIRNGLDVAGLRERAGAFDREAEKQKLGFSPQVHVLLQVARMTPQKRQRLVIDGFVCFHALHPDYRLVLVGGGGMEAEIRSEVERRGLSQIVRVEGNQLEVARYYAMADVFVSTSEIEGFGLAHAEALATGVPLVSTRTAGPDEMIEEGKNGFFITEETPEGVCDALVRMHEAEPESMRSYALESAKRYDIKETVKAYERLIETGHL